MGKLTESLRYVHRILITLLSADIIIYLIEGLHGNTVLYRCGFLPETIRHDWLDHHGFSGDVSGTAFGLDMNGHFA